VLQWQWPQVMQWATRGNLVKKKKEEDPASEVQLQESQREREREREVFFSIKILDWVAPVLPNVL
jgi:hypothetical protein